MLGLTLILILIILELLTKSLDFLLLSLAFPDFFSFESLLYKLNPLHRHFIFMDKVINICLQYFKLNNFRFLLINLLILFYKTFSCLNWINDIILVFSSFWFDLTEWLLFSLIFLLIFNYLKIKTDSFALYYNTLILLRQLNYRLLFLFDWIIVAWQFLTQLNRKPFLVLV